VGISPELLTPGKAGEDQANVATCWAAIRVGQLLGKVKERERTDLNSELSQHCDSGSPLLKRDAKDDRRRFRLLARYRRDLAKMIDAESPTVGVGRADGPEIKRPSNYQTIVVVRGSR
jgi:hypothetical protein